MTKEDLFFIGAVLLAGPIASAIGLMGLGVVWGCQGACSYALDTTYPAKSRHASHLVFALGLVFVAAFGLVYILAAFLFYTGFVLGDFFHATHLQSRPKSGECAFKKR